MWFRKAAKSLLILLVLLPVPALMAPYVSTDPVHWAYRVYHPFMYRYPHRFVSAMRQNDVPWRLEQKSSTQQSLEILSIMVEYW